MTPETFVNTLRLVIQHNAAAELVQYWQDKPGHGISPARKARSEWIKSLTPEGRAHAVALADDAIASAVFGLLAVLDGVRAIEDRPDQGHLELFHIAADGQTRTRLNPPTCEMLHDMFNAGTDKSD